MRIQYSFQILLLEERNRQDVKMVRCFNREIGVFTGPKGCGNLFQDHRLNANNKFVSTP
jgi:hypothetical protein